MPATVKTPKGWEQLSDSTWEKHFGPVRARVVRTLDYKDEAKSHAYGYLDVRSEGCEFSVTYASLGVEWHDDNADAMAVKAIDALMRKAIRSWAK